jgi:hypothetical protein
LHFDAGDFLLAFGHTLSRHAHIDEILGRQSARPEKGVDRLFQRCDCAVRAPPPSLGFDDSRGLFGQCDRTIDRCDMT